MRAIALANQKGGVAKTTTSINLALGLAHRGRKVLLVDMDPQANATLAVLGEDEPAVSVYDLLVGKYAVADVRVPTATANLDLLPSSIDLAGAEVELISAIGGQTRLRTKLSQSPLPYDYVIVDTPPSLGLLTINALAAVREVVIPVSASFFALRGIQKLEATIEQVRSQLNSPNLRVMGVLCTRYNHTNVADDVVQAVRDRFGDLVFETVIAENIKVEEAHSRAEGIFTYAPKSAGARDYGAFVEEVMRHE